MILKKERERITEIIKGLDTYNAIEENDCILIKDLMSSLNTGENK